MPLPKKFREDDKGGANQATEWGNKAVKPCTLPPLFMSAGAEITKISSSVPAVGGGAGVKGLVLPLDVGKAIELPREKTERELRTEKLRRSEPSPAQRVGRGKC